jgi:predicted transcriptional regulator
MLRHMRTTLDLPDPLLRKAQKLAQQQKTTFRAVMAEALRRYLAAEETPRRPFKLPDRSFRGDGLVEGLTETDWGRIRDLSYEGRGP